MLLFSLTGFNNVPKSLMRVVLELIFVSSLTLGYGSSISSIVTTSSGRKPFLIRTVNVNRENILMKSKN